MERRREVWRNDRPPQDSRNSHSSTAGPCFSAQNQGLVADDLAHLRARHHAPAMQEATIRALRRFAVLMPAARQTTLYQDLTQTTPGDIDTWIEASFHQPLAPGTIATRLRVVQGFFAFLRDQGDVPQSPIRRPRHHILVPQDLPRPMAEDEVSAFFRVIDALRDRTMFLLMRRCGLRVSEVSRLSWAALDLAQGTVRIEHSTGHVDRVVSLAPAVAKPCGSGTGSRRWRHARCFPSRLTRKGGMPLSRPANPPPDDPAPSRCAGITKAYSPHSLRHTCATQLLNAGASLGRGQSAHGAPLPRRHAPLYPPL